MKFTITLSRNVLNQELTILTLEAGSQDEAERLAYDRIRANPDNSTWMLYGYGLIDMGSLNVIDSIDVQS